MWRTIVAASQLFAPAAALANDKGDCLDSREHDRRLKDCGPWMQRSAKDIVAYQSRRRVPPQGKRA